MPTARASGARVTMAQHIGLGATTSVVVTFAKMATAIVKMVQDTPRVTMLTGAIEGTGTGRFGVSGTLVGGDVLKPAGLIHATLERLGLVAQALPAVAHLKTEHGGVGISARVQPGEPATDSVVQVVFPRVEAAQAVTVQP